MRQLFNTKKTTKIGFVVLTSIALLFNAILVNTTKPIFVVLTSIALLFNAVKFMGLTNTKQLVYNCQLFNMLEL